MSEYLPAGRQVGKNPLEYHIPPYSSSICLKVMNFAGQNVENSYFHQDRVSPYEFHKQASGEL